MCLRISTCDTTPRHYPCISTKQGFELQQRLMASECKRQQMAAWHAVGRGGRREGTHGGLFRRFRTGPGYAPAARSTTKHGPSHLNRQPQESWQLSRKCRLDWSSMNPPKRRRPRRGTAAVHATQVALIRSPLIQPLLHDFSTLPSSIRPPARPPFSHAPSKPPIRPPPNSFKLP